MTVVSSLAKAGTRVATGAAAVAPAVERWASMEVAHVQGALRQAMRGVRSLWRVDAAGAHNIPASGPFIIAGTHGSQLDDLVYLAGHDRTARLIANAESFEIPVVGSLIARTGRFPVRAGDADEGLAIARRILAQGDGVVIFPEGERVLVDQLGKAHSGVARLALETGAPVIPAAAYGNKPAFTRGEHGLARLLKRIQVVYGEPMRFEGMAATRQNAPMVRDAIFSRMGTLHERARELRAAAPRA